MSDPATPGVPSSTFAGIYQELARQAKATRIAALVDAIGDLDLTEAERRMLDVFAYEASGDDVVALAALLTRLRG